MSNCKRRNIWCKVYYDELLITTFHNGGETECKVCIRDLLKIKSGDLPSICKNHHAEIKSLIFCCHIGFDLKHVHFSISHHPCKDCKELLDTLGIEYVAYKKYP